ncbi:N-acetyl-gamma-glutamyl-phosphate reductase [subsurface metagenome]
MDLTIEAELGRVELAFSAMPHQASAEEVIPLLKQGTKVVDISADFRLKNAAQYGQWYGSAHPAPELLKQAVYGLPELYRSQVASTQLVANPGCYPTGAILALAPAVRAGLIEPDIVIDSKSGLSGAGRSLSRRTHFSEANEDVAAYALEGHRHLPEIAQELNLLSAQKPLSITFVPHLIPMTRGILTTCYASLATGKKGKKELSRIYRDFYKDEPFVRVVESPPPHQAHLGKQPLPYSPHHRHQNGEAGRYQRHRQPG